MDPNRPSSLRDLPESDQLLRSEWAAELYADIRSVIETARRHGIAALEAIRSTLNGLPLAATPLAQSLALRPSG
jgi:hypothetical protein